MSRKKSDIRISPRDVVTVKKAAEMVGRTRLTIYRWIRAGRILSIMFGGYRVIPKSEVERIIRERENKEVFNFPKD